MTRNMLNRVHKSAPPGAARTGCGSGHAAVRPKGVVLDMGRRMTKAGRMNPCPLDAGRCYAAAELARSVEFVAAATPTADAATPLQQHYGMRVIAIATRKRYGVSNHA